MLIVYAGKNKSSLTIIAIAVPISVSMVLFAVGLCFLCRRTGKKYNTLPEENGKQKKKSLVDHHM